ncbi:hypothetical protein [Aphanizomenon flos-aquae]|nr:hypothetical protein [Aphanizomenon flos-aquae]
MTFPVRDWEREFSGFASTEASATGKLKPTFRRCDLDYWDF